MAQDRYQRQLEKRMKSLVQAGAQHALIVAADENEKIAGFMELGTMPLPIPVVTTWEGIETTIRPEMPYLAILQSTKNTDVKIWDPSLYSWQSKYLQSGIRLVVMLKTTREMRLSTLLSKRKIKPPSGCIIDWTFLPSLTRPKNFPSRHNGSWNGNRDFILKRSYLNQIQKFKRAIFFGALTQSRAHSGYNWFCNLLSLSFSFLPSYPKFPRQTVCLVGNNRAKRLLICNVVFWFLNALIFKTEHSDA